MTTAEIFTIIGATAGVGVAIVAAILSVVFHLVNQLNRALSEQKAEMNRQFAEQKAEMNRQFSEQKDALAEQKADTNRRFTELRADLIREIGDKNAQLNIRFDEQRDDMNRRFKEQDSRMDRMEAQHGELVGEGHRMGKRLGRIDMMLELLTQRRPSVRQMFRRRAGDAA